MVVEKGLLYSEDHEWVRVEGDKAYIGVTDHAQDSLGSIVYVELPDVDDEFSKGDNFGVLESVKAASDCYMPVSGKVIEINEDIVDNPALVNKTPYESWMICVELADTSEINELLSPEDYEKIAK